MTPGVKPKPARMHIIAGTSMSTNDAGPEFAPVEVFPPPPEYLNADGREVWNELGTELVSSGVLQVVDMHALEQLAYAWQKWVAQAKAGMDISAAENATLRSLFAEFGCTPSARRRVSTSSNKDKANRFSKFKNPAAHM